MILTNEQWTKIDQLIRQAMVSGASADLASLITTNMKFLGEKNDLKHVGLYCGLFDEKYDQIVSEGFLEDGQEDLASSLARVLRLVRETIKRTRVKQYRLMKSKIFLSIILNCELLTDDLLDWNASRDAVCIQWGDKYSGMFLPYQMALLSGSKEDILDKLCCWHANIPAGIWKYPQCRVWRLQSLTYPESVQGKTV